jgi:hypothetical protein
VTDGIGACENLSHRRLLIEAARSAIRRQTKSADAPDALELLPPEFAPPLNRAFTHTPSRVSRNDRRESIVGCALVVWLGQGDRKSQDFPHNRAPMWAKSEILMKEMERPEKHGLQKAVGPFEASTKK